MEEGNDFSQGLKSSRISQPLESTRMAKVSNHGSSRPVDSPGLDETQDIKPPVEQPGVLMSGLETSDVASSEVKGHEHVKEEFTSLNNRLLTYVDRVRHTEASLAEATNAKRTLEKQIENLKLAHAKQATLLRSELDERVRQAVIAEEKQAELQQRLTKHEQALANRDEALEAHRLQQEELEQALVREKQVTMKEARKAAEFKEAFMKAHEERESLKDECTRLKVEAAKLQERLKVASLEMTMHESKAAAVEKDLLYSSQDLSKKLAEQRKRLEAIGMEKLEELRRKHSSELKLCRDEAEKRLHETLKTYVASEDHAALQTEVATSLKRAEQAEIMLEQRDHCIRELRDEIQNLEKSHQKRMADEKRRRERINKRLLAQSRDLDEIRTELETYRKLLEGLDIDENTFYRTPSGTKRLRTSLELESPSFNLGSRILSSGGSTPNRKGENGTPVTLEARKALLKKVLTPRKRTSSDGDEKVPTSSSERDCMVM